MDGDKGIRILSFDSGGPGSYSQLLILKEYMTRLSIDLGVEEDDLYPADYFDLMGGVGFGGLVALMLGHLRMNVEQATDALLSVASAVFPNEINGKIDPETNLKNLKESIEEILQANNIPLDMKMNDKRRPSAACKVALYATTSANLSHCTAFRTYPSRNGSINPTIADAICATMATPSFFTPVKIGKPSREQIFIGGALGTNNPTRELIREASAVFGKDRRVAQIISIGSGCPRVLSLDQSKTSEQVSRLLEKLALDCEMVAKELSTRLFSVPAYLRLNVERGMENITMEDWTGLGGIESHTSAYVETTAVADALEASLRRLQERIGTVTLGQIIHSSSIKVMAKTAPALSPYHVVRDREYKIMRLHLVESKSAGQKILSITGMGGCGKTQLVSYFLQENRSLFTHVVFMDASSTANIKVDLQAWAQSLGDGHGQDVWEDGLRVLANGHHNGRWAVIFDNGDDPTMDLVPFFPKCYNGTLIITSRNRDVGNLANTHHLELGQMETEEALSTLIRAARRQLPLPAEEMESANTLVKELGCLAVALVHAGTYCDQMSSVISGVTQPYTFTAYLSLFYSQRAALMNRAGPSTLDGYQRGVYTTLDISYQAIPPPIRDFLHFISHFHHSEIPVAMLASAAERRFQDPETYLPRPNTHQNVVIDLCKLLWVDGIWNELQVHNTIRTLRSFSLVTTTTIADSLFIQMHPLVQAWLRDMPLSTTKEYSAMAQQTITSCCTSSGVQIHRYIVPHIKERVQEIQGYSLHVNDRMAAGRVLDAQGHYRDAAMLFSESLNVVRTVSGERSSLSFLVVGYLAVAYRRQGKLEEAEKLLHEALEQCKITLGTENTRTWITSLLAETYDVQGRWAEAEKLKLEVLDQRRKTFGVEHLVTVAAVASMAETYRKLRRFNEAEKLDLEVLEQRRRTLGPNHRDTVMAESNLAVSYSMQQRWDEAETLQLRVLEWCRRFLGAECPDTILAAENLSITYRGQQKWEEAIQLLTLAVDINIKVLGPRHRRSQRSREALDELYETKGMQEKVEEARKLLGS